MTNNIQIIVSGSTGTGKTSIAWLLSDFLDHTGFEVHINSEEFEVDDTKLAQLVHSIPDRLEQLIDKNTIITINEVQTQREDSV